MFYEWRMEQLESQRAKNPSLPSAKRTLKLLNNVNNLHRVVGDALISFVKVKPEPFLTHMYPQVQGSLLEHW